MRHLKAFSLVLLAVTMGAGSARAEKPLLYHVELPAFGTLKFTGSNPPINPELMTHLRQKAAQQAFRVCRALVGAFDVLQKTHEGELEQSIQTYTLSTGYLCGRTTSNPGDLVPSAIHALGENVFGPDDDDFIYRELAKKLLLRLGANAVKSLIFIAEKPAMSETTRRHAMETLGRFLRGEGEGELQGITPTILGSLVRVISQDNDILGYYASEAFAQYFGAYHYAAEMKGMMTELHYATLVYAICRYHNLQSSYAVRFPEIELLLRSQDRVVSDTALIALIARKFSAEEFAQMVDLLGEFVDPQGTRRSGHAAILLGISGQATAIPHLVNAIDSALLENASDHYLLLQAMLGLKNYASTAEAKAALSELQKIAQSTVNPTNDYLQRTAKELIRLINEN